MGVADKDPHTFDKGVFMDLGGVIEFAVPQILPNTFYGYEFFNFFFSLPLFFAVLVIVPLVLIMLINKS